MLFSLVTTPLPLFSLLLTACDCCCFFATGPVLKLLGLTPSDVQVVELHDCFSSNELITYEALGLCDKGGAGAFIDRGDNTYGGKYVVNPSGGLISKGHPIGATGLAQCAELCWQVRGLAGKRQVSNATVGLQHNLGLGGAVVVSLYKMGFPEANTRRIQANPTSASSESDFKCAPAFTQIKQALDADGGSIVKKMKGVFNFKVKTKDGKEGNWVVDVKNGNGDVKFNCKEKSDCTVILSDDDLLKLMEGKLNPQTAFFQGKIKITGNMALALKLKDIMPKPGSKL